MREKPFADYPDIVNIDQLREMLGGALATKQHTACCMMGAYAVSR